MKEVRYTKEVFIKSFPHAKGIAEKYCNENQKEDYGSEDFRAMYYLTPSVVGNGGPVGHGLWDESQSTMDRLITTFERNEWGE